MSGSIEPESIIHCITDSSSYSPPLDLLFGTLRASTDFTRLETIGDGSSATVHKAKDNKSNQIVAIKCPKQKRASQHLSSEEFREIVIHRSLDNQNVIKLIEVITGSHGNICMVLEYHPYSLSQLIDEKGHDLPSSQIKCIMKQLFSGLNYIHKNYVMHRDVKPSNVIISQEGVLKLADFGLSRRLTLPPPEMNSDVVTRWYRAPEILLQAPSYDCSIDIWAAACIFVELFTRKPILQGDSDLDQISKIIKLLGTPTPNVWPGFSKCEVPRTMKLLQQPFNKLEEQFQHLSGALDLLRGLFVYNPRDRLPACQCLRHDWFQQAPFPSQSIEIPASLTVGLAVGGR